MNPSFCFSFIFRYETVKNILSSVYAHSGQKVALKGHRRVLHTIRGAVPPIFPPHFFMLQIMAELGCDFG
jgi:hypothetical protein